MASSQDELAAHPVSCKKAFYVKLGRNGLWEKSSLAKSVIRIGWRKQKITDINQGNWDKIQRELEQEIGDKGAATRDYRALRMLCESNSDDVWITFHANHLWWCRVSEARIYEDKVSKNRKEKEWLSHDILGNPLLITGIPGSIAKLQGFRGTICRVSEVEDLKRILNRQYSSEYVAILHSKDELSRHVERGIRRLHWKDFETLVDLVFRASGWRRVSVLGETMNYADIELEDPITGDMYQVQVKSSAGLHDFQDYCARFAGGKYRKFFFVVHSPDKGLAEHSQSTIDSYTLISPGRLAQMVVDLGLVNWLMNKIR